MVDIYECGSAGYKPLFTSGEWIIACLNFLDAAWPENVTSLESHCYTDEVFIPVNGKMDLLVKTTDSNIQFISMEQGKVYNVKQGMWHGLVMGEGAKCFIVKTRDQEGFKDVKHLTLTPKEVSEITRFYSN